MSKKSREQARQSRQKPAWPKGIAVVGVVAVIAIGIAAGRMLAGPPSAAQADGVAAAQSAAPGNGAVSTAASATAPRKKLLFFMNPDGYPCQTQLGILNGVADSLSKVAEVVYIKTTEPADLQKFEEYGIRGLPSLVIADMNGREVSRFSPGIQSGDAVLAALTK